MPPSTTPHFPTYTVSPIQPSKAMVAAPITYHDSRLVGGSLTVPMGFSTDGASIPRPFRWIIGQPLSPRFWRASLIHDYLYQERLGKQKDADDILLDLLEKDGVGKIRRYLMWAALRGFGWIWWRT